MFLYKYNSILKVYWLPPFISLLGALLIFFSPLGRLRVPGFVSYHTLLEAFCIVISLMIFTTQFVLRKYSSSGLYQILGIPYLGIGIIDLLHTLSYKGVPDLVTANTPQKSIAFWLAARFLEAGTFLYFALHSKHKWPTRSENQKWLYAGVLLYTALTTLWILVFPDLVPQFTEPTGQITNFKKELEYLLIFGHLYIFYLLVSTPNENSLSEHNQKLLASASLVIAVSGLCFSSFSDGHDLVIFTGHLLKVLAYYYIFKAALQSELLQPYHHLMTLNRELQAHTESLYNIKAQLLKSERLNAIGINTGIFLHDLNNLIQVADLSAKKILKLASENESSEKIKTYSSTLISSLDKTRSFQKLLLQQMKSGDTPVTQLNLRHALLQFEPLLKALAGDNEFTLECEEDLLIFANQVELEQILMNLVANAKDALMDSPGQIRVEAKKAQIQSQIMSVDGLIPHGNYVQLAVIDNGCGIAPEAMNRIFEPFYTTKGPQKGTGLGLPTIKYIVEKWQAFLHIQSNVNHGTEFRIYLKEVEN